MNDQFKGKYRVSSARMTNWDYGSHGLYYITICTKDRINYFGEIVPEQNVETQNLASPKEVISEHDTKTQNLASLRRTLIGEVAFNNWLDIPNHFPFVELDEFVIMPNHIHSILFINKPDKIDWQANKFGAQSRNLASIIRGYKASVKTYATLSNIEFHWQPRYHDRIIRDEREYLNVRAYIINNPLQWLLSGDNEKDLYF